MRISELQRMNPWRKLGRDFGLYDKDLCGTKPARFIREFPNMSHGKIIKLMGPRQVGKTTLIKTMIEKLLSDGVDPSKILYLSLDRLSGKRELHDALRLVRKPEFIYLDEVSRLPGAMQEVKVYADEGSLVNASMLLTGSSPTEIERAKELAPGRGAEGQECYLRPLLFRDLVMAHFFSYPQHLYKIGFEDQEAAAVSYLQKILPNVAIDLDSDGPEEVWEKIIHVEPFINELNIFFSDVYLHAGGFPRSINAFLDKKLDPTAKETSDRVNEVANLFIQVVLGDLAAAGKSETLLRRIMRKIVQSYGSRFSFHHLARDAEGNMGIATVQSYLELIERSLLLHVICAMDLEKGEASPRKEKKVYFQDPFIFYAFLAYLKGLSTDDAISTTLEDEEMLGVLIEGVVLSHLVSHMELPVLKNPLTFLGFYYDNRQRELDALVMPRSGKKIGIEVRYGRSRSRKGLKKIEGLSWFLCLTKDEMRKEGDCIYLPTSLFLALLPRSRSHL